MRVFSESFMNSVIRFLTALLLFTACLVLVTVGQFFLALKETTQSLPATVDRAIAREAELTRKMITSLALEAQQNVNRQITELRKERNQH